MKRAKGRIKLSNIKNKKLVIFIVALFIVLLTLGPTLARFVYDMYSNHILETKGFYFNSSVMTSLGSNHSINNWDGVNAYQLTIDVNNRKNEYIYTETDIAYDISVECSDNIRCVLSKTSGVIYKESHTDSYTITIYPVGNFSNNQTATITTEATSSSPFVKTLSTTYNVSIEKSKFSYNIDDTAGNKYFVLELTNAITYYKVIEAFNTYAVGDNISIEEYTSLSDENKKKCLSARITLEFDPNDILLDMTDSTYLKRLNEDFQTVKINNYDYVKKFAFTMDASSTTKIIFYKNDSSKDYTYPSSRSIVRVEVYSVEDMN